MHRLFASLLLIVAAGVPVTAAAQGQRDAPPMHTSGDRIEITSISPRISSILKAGQKVRVKVQFKYSASVRDARVRLLAQTPAPEYAPLADASLLLDDTSGVGELSVEFVVPRTRTVTIYLPLYVVPGQSTTTVDSRTYEVK
jgi:hypothetical protein